jgi:hypothetical protein
VWGHQSSQKRVSTETWQEGLPDRRPTRTQEMSWSQCKEGTSIIILTPLFHTQWSNNSLNAAGWTGDKPCLMTINTRASVTITRPDITAGLPKRKPSRPYVMQMVSKRTMVELTRGQSTLQIWVFVTRITQIHPGAGHPMSLQHNSQWEAQCAATEPRRDAMVSWSQTTMIPPYAGQWQDDTNSMWEGGYCTAEAAA